MFAVFPRVSGGSAAEDIPVQTAEGFLYFGQRQGQVHADAPGIVEEAAVLPGNAHIGSFDQQVIQGHAMCFTPFFTVNEEHIGAFRFHEGDTGETFTDEITGEVDVSAQYAAELVNPFLSLRLIRADERMHVLT